MAVRHGKGEESKGQARHQLSISTLQGRGGHHQPWRSSQEEGWKERRGSEAGAFRQLIYFPPCRGSVTFPVRLAVPGAGGCCRPCGTGVGSGNCSACQPPWGTRHSPSWWAWFLDGGTFNEKSVLAFITVPGQELKRPRRPARRCFMSPPWLGPRCPTHHSCPHLQPRGKSRVV